MSSEEELTEELNEQNKKHKKEADYLVEVKHTKGDEPDNQGDLAEQLEAEKKRRETLEIIVEAESLRHFETEKESLLKAVPENRRQQLSDFIGDDVDKMSQVKASLLLSGQDFDDEDSEENEKTPSGRATLPDYMLPEGQRGQSRSPTYSNPVVQQYSDLYAIIRDPKSTVEQKAEAEQVLDETFAEIKKGLRNRSKNNPYSLPTGVVNHCMKCGFVTEIDLSGGTPCPNCGYRFGIDDFPRNPKFQPR